MTTPTAISLYDQDVLLWTEDTVNKLKTKEFSQLDLENLIEEVEVLGKSLKRELKKRLMTLLEHFLKRLYLDSPNDYRGWEITTREQRQQIELELEDSPSLLYLWADAFEAGWRIALKAVRSDYPRTAFPDQWQFPSSLDQVLNCKFWEEK